MGSRRISVAAFADICHIPLRTLEWRLARARMMRARELLRWMVVLHSFWHLDVRRQTPKYVARRMGFSSAAVLGHYLGRACGRSPAAVILTAGFYGLLDQFVTACLADHDHKLRVHVMASAHESP